MCNQQQQYNGGQAKLILLMIAMLGECRGYRTARTWLGVAAGEWYFEVRIEEPSAAHRQPSVEPHVR
jgi:hypothetical protein